MSWFDKLFGSKPEPAARVANLSAGPRVSSRPILETGFRRGMWVVWPSKAVPGEVEVGILLEVSVDGTATVDKVRPDGTTELAGLKIPVGDIRQATYDQIPNGRKPRNTEKNYGLKRDRFARMGYN